MMSGISTMGSYYLMYQHSSGYGRSLGYAAGQMQRMPQVLRTAGEQSQAVLEADVQKSATPSMSEAAKSGMIEAAAFQRKGDYEVPDLFLREGVDPTEYAVRMRIQYLEEPSMQEGLDKVPGKQIDSVQESAKEGECQTCAQRKYQDGSDDMGVSFQTPTKISPEAAPAAVRGHEQEHVSREQAKAKREGKEVVSQSVVIHTSVCPECGKVYVSGGTTRTTTATKPEEPKYDSEESSSRRPFSAVA